MKKIRNLFIIFLLLFLGPYLLQLTIPFSVSAQTIDYTLSSSSYLGGSGPEHARDVAIDAQGNIIIAGGTGSANFPVTLTDINTTPCPLTGSFGNWDTFVTKFSPTGSLLWSRRMGGMCYDRVYGLEVDLQGNIYIAGRSGEGFPVTTGVFQTTFRGTNAGSYGNQNTFVAKLDANGNKIWASYAGTGNMARDIAVDDLGDIYIPLGYSGSGPYADSAWFTNAYQQHQGAELKPVS